MFTSDIFNLATGEVETRCKSECVLIIKSLNHILPNFSSCFNSWVVEAYFVKETAFESFVVIEGEFVVSVCVTAYNCDLGGCVSSNHTFGYLLLK